MDLAVKNLIFYCQLYACIPTRERIIGLKNIKTNIQFHVFIGVFSCEGSRKRKNKRGSTSVSGLGK